MGNDVINGPLVKRQIVKIGFMGGIVTGQILTRDEMQDIHARNTTLLESGEKQPDMTAIEREIWDRMIVGWEGPGWPEYSEENKREAFRFDPSFVVRCIRAITETQAARRRLLEKNSEPGETGI